VAKPTAMMLGSALDARFLRAKSPRSRQYVLRLPAGAVHTAKQEKITKLAVYRRLRKQQAARPCAGRDQWVRSRRRSFFHSVSSQNTVVPLQAALDQVRATMRARYAPATLMRQCHVTTGVAAVAAQYNFPNRRATVHVTHWLKQRSRQLIRQVRHCRPLFGATPEEASSRIVQSSG
jgi:hypothetical protein